MGRESLLRPASLKEVVGTFIGEGRLSKPLRVGFTGTRDPARVGRMARKHLNGHQPSTYFAKPVK